MLFIADAICAYEFIPYQSLHVAVSYVFSLLATAVTIFMKELLSVPLTGMFFPAVVFIAMFALSVSLHKRVIIRMSGNNQVPVAVIAVAKGLFCPGVRIRLIDSAWIDAAKTFDA
ncbi:MAG: hypothetical protein ABFS24_00680 [Pseudomonadota bacterium]